MIDHRLELGRLLYGRIHGLGALQDLVHLALARADGSRRPQCNQIEEDYNIRALRSACGSDSQIAEEMV